MAVAQEAPAGPPVHALLERVAVMKPGTFEWEDDRTLEGPVAITISLSAQRIYVYRGQTLIGVSSISTGKGGKPTPVGDYVILQKHKDHVSNIYDNAPMPYMQRLTWDGIAIHAGHDPGFPASHGCIRVPLAFAKNLFAVTSLGASVSVAKEVYSRPAYIAMDRAVLTDETLSAGS
jgi:hypothetical protein